jgi:hypothetical protein
LWPFNKIFERHIIVTKRKNIFNHGKKISILYMTLGPKDTIVFTKAKTYAELYHCRLDHICQRSIKLLLLKRKLLELKSIYLTCVRVVFLENLKKLNFIKNGKSFMLRKLEL